jgi:hypothetical protein
VEGHKGVDFRQIWRTYSYVSTMIVRGMKAGPHYKREYAKKLSDGARVPTTVRPEEEGVRGH